MADGDFNLATIWASIVPETSKVGPAMEEAGEEAKRRWTDKVKDFGKTITDDLEKVGPKAKDTFGHIGDSLKTAISKASFDGGKDLTDNLSKAGSDAAHGLVSNFSGAEGPIGAIAERIGGLIGGKLGDAIHSLDEPLKSVGIDIGAWQNPIQDVVGKAAEFKGEIGSVADILKGLPGVIGTVGAALSEALGPLTAAIAGGLELDKLTKGPMQHGPGYGIVEKFLESHGMHFPGATSFAPPTPPPAPVGAPGIPVTPDSLLGALGALPPGAPPIGAPHGTAPSGNTVPLMQNPDGTWTSPNPAWAHLIARESGGNPSVFNNYDSNAVAGDPSQGLFQFTRATWARSGGLKYGRDPSKATPAQQAEIAANLIRANPSGSDWGAGMSGRESASGLLSGLGAGGGASSGANFYKDWYPASDAGGGGGWTPSGSLSSRGGGTGSGGTGLGAPTGAQHDPLYVMHADDTTAAAGGSSPMESQGQQLGKGLVGGLLQGLGLDGSVFHTFNGKGSPLDFGSVKMGMGLLNWGMGLLGSRGGGGDGGASIGGAGGGGGLGSMLPGLGSLIPHPNAAALHGDAPPGGGGGATTHIYGNTGPTLNVTQNGQSPTSDLQETVNGAGNRLPAYTAPNAGPILPGTQ